MQNLMKRICIIYCGGTIAMQKNPDGSLAPAKKAPKLLEMFPGIEKLADFGSRFIANIDSTNMHPEIYRRLAMTIAQDYNEYDGFVITHGTDTMAYTAAALSFALRNLKKPVVLTGSQKPIFELESDAPYNFINAVKVASMNIPEVCIVFGSDILRGNRAKKISATKLNAYCSPLAPLLGKIGKKIKITKTQILKPSQKTLEIISGFENNIMFCQLFPGLEPKIIDMAIENGYKGIILNAYGTGNVPNDGYSLIEAIANATARNIPVIIASQCLQGTVISDRYEVGSAAINAGAISALDMTSETAIIKLMWVLAQTNNMQGIKQLMQKKIAGEISGNEDM